LGISSGGTFFAALGSTYVTSDVDRVGGKDLSRLALFTMFGVKTEIEVGERFSVPLGMYYRNEIDHAGYFITLRTGIA